MNSFSEIGKIFFGCDNPDVTVPGPVTAAASHVTDQENASGAESHSKITEQQREALRELGRRGGRKRAANRKTYKENTPAAALAKADESSTNGPK